MAALVDWPHSIGERRDPTMPRPTGRVLVAQNKKARHDYEIGERFEAGLVLTGTEVKSLRGGRCSLTDGFATVDDGEVFLPEPALAHLFGEDGRRSGRARKDHQPRDLRVEPVHRADALRAELRAQQLRRAARLIRRQNARRLHRHDDPPVLIHNLHRIPPPFSLA